jgi:taurine---2-oxoglutarate transaminase
VGNARRLGDAMRAHHASLLADHPSVGRVRNLGLFGIVELVKSRDTMEPLSPFNVLNETMAAINHGLMERGLFTMVRFNGIMTNPPLCITAEQLDEGFAVIDDVLTAVADPAVT